MFDGVTASQGVNTTFADVGTSDLTVSITFKVPASNPSASIGLFWLGTSTTTYEVAATLYGYLSSAGTLFFTLNGAVYPTDSATKSYVNFIAQYAGKVVTVTGVRSTSGLTFKVYINGVEVVVAETLAGSGAWSDTVTSTYFRLGRITSSLVYNNPIYSAHVFNRALTASQVLDLCNNGVAETDKWGSLVAKYTSDFSAGVDSWTADFGAVNAPVTIGGISNALQQVADGGATQCRCYRAVSGMQIGKRYRLTYDLYIPANGSGVRVVWKSSTNVSLTGSVLPTASTWTSYSVEFTQTAGNGGIKAQLRTSGESDIVTTGDMFYLKNVVLTQIGSILSPDLTLGVGYQAPDLSTNKYNGVITTTGVSHVKAKRSGQIRTTTNTSGNQQILAQVCLPTNAIITSIVAYSTGTPSVYVGNVSAGNQLVTVVALVASTYTSLSLVVRTTTTGNVWVNSSTADTINWVINYEIAEP